VVVNCLRRRYGGVVTVQNGAQFAQLLLAAFDAMVEEVREELDRAGHAGLTVANERVMQAIDGGAVSAASLARAVGVTRQAAAKTISTLESLGYVTREADADDARQKSLVITPAGRRAVAVGAKAFDEIFDRWRSTEPRTSAATIDGLERLIAETRELRHG
jgi:DNA-binding MarR family transcriptional regulator